MFSKIRRVGEHLNQFFAILYHCVPSLSHASKSYASSYKVEILNSFNPELQVKNSESVIKNKLIDLLTELKGFKFVTIIVFNKIKSDDKPKYETVYSHLKAEVIIKKSDIDGLFKSIYTTVISYIKVFLGQGLGWIIDSVIDHNINISKYNPLVGSSYIKLPKELDHPKKV